MDQGENAKTVREVVNMDIFAVEGDKWVSVIVNLLIMQASLLIASCCLAGHCRNTLLAASYHLFVAEIRIDFRILLRKIIRIQNSGMISD